MFQKQINNKYSYLSNVNFLSKTFVIFILLSILFSSKNFGQTPTNNFYIDNGRKYEKIPFVLSGSQIILKLRVNGSNHLNFILDSGVKTPIIIDVPQFDTISIKDYKRINVKGLGNGSSIEALVAYNNKIEIGESIVNNNQSVIVLLEDIFNLTNKLGHTVNGIIGFDIFRDFIVEINYDKQYLKLHDPKKYKYKRRSRYTSIPLHFNRYKPYVFLDIKTDSSSIITTKLLVDTGGSDVLWLFADSHDEINYPDNYIFDFLGSGLSGDIYGRRARVKGVIIGEHIIESPTVSYPDSSSVAYVMMHKERNGSIGGGMLSRFKVIIDYTNKKISFKKGNRFKHPFNYNMSGIELRKPYNNLPIYEVSEIRKGSVADEIGIKAGDVLKMVNYTKIEQMSLPKIMSTFREKHGKRVILHVTREGKPLKFKFRLEKTI